MQDIIIDTRTLGSTLLLVDVLPAYEYKDNKRTENIIGYKYAVAMPEHGLDKISVKIEGKKLMEAPDSYVEVQFKDLELFMYMMNGKAEIGARAKGIALAGKQ